MQFNEYQALALRTAAPMPTQSAHLAHACIGMQTESGEFATEVKRMAYYNKPMTEEMRLHMIEEVGDLLWYVALAAEHLGTSLRSIARENIAKLSLRYPDKFSDLHAEARADKAGLPATLS